MSSLSRADMYLREPALKIAVTSGRPIASSWIRNDAISSFRMHDESPDPTVIRGRGFRIIGLGLG